MAAAPLVTEKGWRGVLEIVHFAVSSKARTSRLCSSATTSGTPRSTEP